MAIKMYRMPGAKLPDLARALCEWLETQGYETQTIDMPDGVTIQGRNMSSWVQKQGVALQIQVRQQGENLQAEVGTSKWAVQAASGVAALIVFWPLLALPAFAAYKQKQIIDETWRWLDQYAASGGDVPVTGHEIPAQEGESMDDEPVLLCGSCGAEVSSGAKFCSNCGNKIQTECANCGAELLPGARFCEECGTPVATE